jgi:biopolymer transport protein TolR
MGMSGGSKGGELNSEINVTPMVDVMLVLLIIFMVTAPLMNDRGGVDLTLPQAGAPITKAPAGDLILRIDMRGVITLSGTTIPLDDLEVKLAANTVVQEANELFIEADRDLKYGVVLDVMARVRAAGVEKLMMVTEIPEEGQ